MVHRATSSIHRMVRHNLVEAQLVRPFLSNCDVRTLRNHHVSHFSVVVQNQASGALQVPRGGLFLHHGHVQQVLVCPSACKHGDDVLASLQLPVGNLHWIQHHGASVLGHVRAEPVVGEAGVGRAVPFTVRHQVDLQTSVFGEHFVEALVLLQHFASNRGLGGVQAAFLRPGHEEVVLRGLHVGLEPGRCHHQDLVRGLLGKSGRPARLQRFGIGV
mmetsp:Transcript_35475/g.67976  ORF Transcript_35475/g.67976 Transcript_35475/m.67976 type:complete len:216 (+) Transcript_35475:551-1198(+)